MQERHADPRQKTIKRNTGSNKKETPVVEQPEPFVERPDPQQIAEELVQQEEAQKISNPLMAKARIPGQTFTMPSGGVFYTHGEIDGTVVNGEVMVFPMVTIDEIIMKTPDKLLNGTAIESVFEHCIPQVKKPLELLSKDIDYLMICLRKVSYGEEFPVEYTHNCADAKLHSYVIPLDVLLKQSKRINTKKAKDNYSIVLPNSQVAKLTPTRYREMLKFYQTFGKENATDEEIFQQIIESTLGMIESIDGISDRGMILEWIQAVPAMFVTKIGEKVAELSEWGVPVNHEITCRDCGENVTVDISLNPINFFS